MTYKACCYMNRGLCFDNIDLRDCSIGLDGNKRGMPVIIPSYMGEVPDWNEVFEIKEKRNKLVKSGKVPQICEGCGCLSEDRNLDDDRCFSEIFYRTSYICDAKCIYCATKVYAGTEFYSAYDATKDLIKNKLFKKGGNVIFDGGEPTLAKDFSKILALYLKKDANIFIQSSGINFSEKICDGLKSGKLKLTVSLDCASKKLYKEIKRTDKFKEVKDNLKKYAKCLNKDNEFDLSVKYIIIPGVNDSIEEIDKFFDLMKKLKIKSVIFDSECKYTSSNDFCLPDYIYEMGDYAKNLAEENQMKFLYNIFFDWANGKRTCKKVDFAKFDKEKFVEKIEKEKKANINKNVYYPGVSRIR